MSRLTPAPTPVYLTAAQVASMLASDRGSDGRTSPRTVRRWMRHGASGLVLRHVRTPAGPRTTAQWVAEFLDGVSEAARDGEPSNEARAVRTHERLAALGLVSTKA